MREEQYYDESLEPDDSDPLDLRMDRIRYELRDFLEDAKRRGGSSVSVILNRFLRVR